MITHDSYSSIGKSAKDRLDSWRKIIASYLKGRSYKIEISRHAEMSILDSGETMEEAEKRITDLLMKEVKTGNIENNLKRLRIASVKSRKGLRAG